MNLLLENVDDWHGGVHVGVEPLLQGRIVVVASPGSGSSSGQTPSRTKKNFHRNDV